MSQAVYALLSGLVFGLGLVLSGMTQPSKVIAFLDVSGAWDPSLALVMLGAIAVYCPLYHLLYARSLPPTAAASISPRAGIDKSLVAGAVLFGIGWGISGLCPGPALVSLGSGGSTALVFSVSMLAGMFLFRSYARLRSA